MESGSHQYTSMCHQERNQNTNWQEAGETLKISQIRWNVLKVWLVFRIVFSYRCINKKRQHFQPPLLHFISKYITMPPVQDSDSCFWLV